MSHTVHLLHAVICRSLSTRVDGVGGRGLARARGAGRGALRAADPAERDALRAERVALRAGRGGAGDLPDIGVEGFERGHGVGRGREGEEDHEREQDKRKAFQYAVQLRGRAHGEFA